MSTVGKSRPDRRRRSSGRHGSVKAQESPLVLTLTQLTDAALFATLLIVTACFGGRTPIGQLLLAGLAAGTAILWSLRQLAAESPAWRSTSTLWIWGLGAVIALIQVLPLTTAWLHWLSPEHGRLLQIWGDESFKLLPAWTTLSFNPSETVSGLVTFLCYALVFLVAVQRIQIIDDVEMMLKGIACLGISAALFGLLQYFSSNGLFFWVYQHPTVSTSDVVLGTFSNRNHFAQFMAAAVGPALWWLAVGSPAERQTDFGGDGPAQRRFATVFVVCGLIAILLAGLMSLSRAGSAAVAAALVTALLLLGRRGHLPATAVPVVLGIIAAAGVGAAVTSYGSLSDRIDNYVADERSVIWAANLRLTGRFPWFGTGVGTHVFTHQLETDRIDDGKEFSHAECGYLQIASECGLLGVGVTLGMIALCLVWCLRAYRADAGARSTAAAAAILASFVANLLHAGVDFFWFTPGCMLVIAVLAACACRLSQMARAQAGIPEPVRPRSRPLWAGAICGLTALAAWMICVKLPGAIAEPHRVAYLNLRYHAAEFQAVSDADADEVEMLKAKELAAAARANPQDCRAQLGAAAGYIYLFGKRQESGENPMSLDQLRDAAISSGFESREALHAWLDGAVGANMKYLKAARHYARRTVQSCPLEGMGYIYLSRLDFLDDPESGREEVLREQALTVRPFDAAIDFEVGKSESWQGDTESAMVSWKRAFRRSPKYRKEIAVALAEQFPATDLIAEFEPDWSGLGVLHAAYEAAGREDDLPLLQERYIQTSLKRARDLSGTPSEQAWLEAVRVYREAGQFDDAIQTAESALDQHSQCLELHKTLGQLLLDRNDFNGAAKHLQWAAIRSPLDGELQRLTADVVKQKLRFERSAERAGSGGDSRWR